MSKSRIASPVQSTQTIAQPAGVSAIFLYLPVSLIIALHVIGALRPGFRMWGVDMWSTAPPWAVVALPVIYLSASIPGVTILLSTIMDAAYNFLKRATSALPVGVIVTFLSLCLLALFFFFRSRALVYGDGFLVKDRLTLPLGAPFSDVHEFTKPLTIYVYRLGWRICSSFGLMRVATFALVSAFCGVIGTWGLITLVRRLSLPGHARRALLLGTISCTCTVLFFGYVEQYTLSTALLIWWAVALVGYYRGRTRFYSLAAITLLLLASNVLLLPVLMFLLVRPQAENRGELVSPGISYAFGLRSIHFLGLALVGSLGVAAFIQFADVPIAIVPVVAKTLNPYWFLLPAHLSDMVNLVLHVAPVGLFALLSWRFSGPKSAPAEGSLLLMVAAVLLITSFWFDPVLGAARDWDLLSSFGFPLTIAGIVLLISKLHDARRTQILEVQMLLALSLVLVPNIIEKNSLARATERLDRIVADCPQYSDQYKRAYNVISWGTILANESNRGDLAEKYAQRRLAADPTDGRSWFNLGMEAYRQNKIDSAVLLLGRAYQLDTTAENRRAFYGLALHRLAKHAQDIPILSGVNTARLQDLELIRSVGTALAQDQLFPRAVMAFHRALQLNPTEFTEWSDLGLVFSAAGQNDSALYYFLQGKAYCPPESRCSLLEAILIEQIRLQNLSGAQTALNEYASACPGDPNLEGYRRTVTEGFKHAKL